MTVICNLIVDMQTILFKCLGWLLTRPPAQKDIIYSEFEAVFPKLYAYVIQFLEPKMEVKLFLFLVILLYTVHFTILLS